MSGSGGGSATEVVQQHLINMHGDWLARCVDGNATIFPSLTMVDLLNGAFGTDNPFIGLAAYDGASEFKAMDAILQRFSNHVNNLDLDSASLNTPVNDTDYDELQPPEVGEEDFRNAIRAYDEVLSENLLDSVIPRFTVGMRDANATNGSAFVLGKAMLHRAHERDVAAYAGDLDAKFALGKLDYKTKWELAKLVARVDLRSRKYLIRYESATWAREVNSQLMHYGVEIERMKLTRRAEEAAQNANLRDAEFRVPFEAYQYGANLMAAIAGGTAPLRQSSGSSTQSVIGGALQGMSVGSQVGSSFRSNSGGDYSGWGALLGGIAGAIANK